MSNYIERMEQEYLELFLKWTSLKVLLGDPDRCENVSEKHLRLMRLQQQHMLQYLSILRERIDTSE